MGNIYEFPDPKNPSLIPVQLCIVIYGRMLNKGYEYLKDGKWLIPISDTVIPHVMRVLGVDSTILPLNDDGRYALIPGYTDVDLYTIWNVNKTGDSGFADLRYRSYTTWGCPTEAYPYGGSLPPSNLWVGELVLRDGTSRTVAMGSDGKDSWPACVGSLFAGWLPKRLTSGSFQLPVSRS